MTHSLTTPADFGELLLRLYRLSHERPLDHFQDDALRLLRAVLPFDASMWGTARTTPHGIDVHTLHLFDKSPEMMVEFEPLKHRDTASGGMLASAERRRTAGFHTDSWFGGHDEREFRDYLRRWNQNNIFITTDHNRDMQFAHWISLFRADTHDHCRPEEVGLLDQLAPHLMQALAMNRKIHLTHLHPGSPAHHGAAIADLRGVLYHADEAFESLLRRQWTGWRGDRMPAALLEHFLRGQARCVGTDIVVSQRLDHGLLFLVARPRCQADALTERELAIAQLLARGSTYKEIARQQQRAPATVRNQIRSIYGKLGVSHVAGVIEALREAA